MKGIIAAIVLWGVVVVVFWLMIIYIALHLLAKVW